MIWLIYVVDVENVDDSFSISTVCYSPGLNLCTLYVPSPLKLGLRLHTPSPCSHHYSHPLSNLITIIKAPKTGKDLC